MCFSLCDFDARNRSGSKGEPAIWNSREPKPSIAEMFCGSMFATPLNSSIAARPMPVFSSLGNQETKGIKEVHTNNRDNHEELRSSRRNSILLVVGRRGYFEDGEEGFLRDIHLADALHAALAFFLFFEEFALAGNVSAVAFGENVFADGRNGFARDDAAANRGLDRHLKHLPRNELSQARHQVAPALRRKFAMDDQRQRIDWFAGDQHIQFDEVGFDISGEMIIEGGVAA